MSVGLVESHPANPDMVYPNLMLKITWETETTEHDGYCSDSGEHHTTTDKKTDIYPLGKMFKKSDVDLAGNVNTSNGKLNIYQRRNVGCGQGSGYGCNSGISYLMKKVKIVKTSDLVIHDLDA
jgi:hypothetical protein